VKLPEGIAKVSAAQILSLRQSDILHIKVGLKDVGDGQPWIPDTETLHQVRDAFKSILPNNHVVVTHSGIEASVIRIEEING
jgi:hypothetical protein